MQHTGRMNAAEAVQALSQSHDDAVALGTGRTPPSFQAGLAETQHGAALMGAAGLYEGSPSWQSTGRRVPTRRNRKRPSSSPEPQEPARLSPPPPAATQRVAARSELRLRRAGCVCP